MPKFQRAFFERDTLSVARALLGQRLIRSLQGQRISGRIVEVEAYVGEDDAACHASSGRTARNAVMFGSGGHAYVYFVYGMHHCFNVVTEEEGMPAAVLVRALEPVEGIDLMRARRGGREGVELTNGPAKLCYALEIDRSLNGTDLVLSDELWLEREATIGDDRIGSGPRVGIRGDQTALAAAWRFWVTGCPYVSKR